MNWYTTPEIVRNVSDNIPYSKNDSLNFSIESASRIIDSECHRKFYPSRNQIHIYNHSGGLIDLDEDLLEINSISASFGTIFSSGYEILPRNTIPKDQIQITQFLDPGELITISGTWGYSNNFEESKSSVVGEITNENTLEVDFCINLDIGNTIRLRGTQEILFIENIEFIEKNIVINLSLSAKENDQVITYTNDTNTPLIKVGELIRIDSEIMKVVSLIKGNPETLIVERDYLNTPVSSHDAGSDIYIRRELQLQRSVNGSSLSAVVTNGKIIEKLSLPKDIEQSCAAMASYLMTHGQRNWSNISELLEGSTRSNTDYRLKELMMVVMNNYKKFSL